MTESANTRYDSSANQTPTGTPWAVTRRSEAASTEQSRLRADEQIEWLRGYAATRINSTLIDERRCIPPYVALDFGAQGLFGPLIEERYGGTAVRFRDIARVAEQLAAIDVGLGTWVLSSVFLGTRALSAWGTPELSQEWLPQLASGRVLGAYAQTEPGAGSDFTRITTRAVPADGGWLLDGEKHWIGNGSWAGVVTVITQAANEQGAPAGITALAVPMCSPGASSGEEHLSLGLRGMVQSRLSFRNVAVSASCLLAEGQGTRVAVDSMSMSRFAISALALGAMRRCLQMGHRFARRRVISGRVLAGRGAALASLSWLAVRIETAEALVYGLADQLDAGLAVEMEPLIATKVLLSEWAVQAADLLMQLLGGRGYDEANGAARLYRDLRVYRIFEGATEVLTDFLGARLLSRPSHIDQMLSFSGPGARDVTGQLRDCAALLARREPGAHEPMAVSDLRRALAGRAVLRAFALAAARRGGGGLAEAVAEREFGWALNEAGAWADRESWTEVLGSAELADAAVRCGDHIGDVDQFLPGGRTAGDPLLRQAGMADR